jgi:[acyl-carrier-protein] S-malonyltransferase
MRDASKKLEEALSNIPFNSPQIPVIHNYDANCYTDPNKIKEMLIKQLYSPVQWVKVINKILASTANIVECGPGKVLSGLNKRIDQNISSYNLHNITDLATVLSSLTSS